MNCNGDYMVYALILAGGNGIRFGSDVPKQYMLAKGKPIISYCLDKFSSNELVDKIIIVATNEWYDYIKENMAKKVCNKFVGFASAGKSRQHSILNGLVMMRELGAEDEDIVMIHDSARPCVSNEIITDSIIGIEMYDGIMPVISVKDTVYYSEDGKTVSKLIDRDKLFAGQTPESFRFKKYYDAVLSLDDDELLSIKGTTELAFKKGLNVSMISGEESNFKITTMDDYDKFLLTLRG